jgi:5-methylcytosine-specific restriction enzyme subunit McrC
MMMLEFADLSPYTGELSGDDDKWLAKVARIDPRDFRIGIQDDRPEDDEWLPLVERGHDGRWWAGRFIGSMTVDGRRLTVRPRLGIDVVEAWLDQAFGLVAPPASARHAETETFIVRLLARLWCRAVDNATRHSLPMLRLPRSHEGLFVRGRLDIRQTIRLMGEGQLQVASVTYDRTLDHPVTRALVRAEHSLAQRLTDTAEWRTERVRQVMPHLRAAVGSRPKLPTAFELARVRYTPITLPFKQAALLSHRIASKLGYSARDEPGVAEGILVDVAELWELFVLHCAQRAIATGFRIEHGTTAGRRDYLLHSKHANSGMGRLKPDVLVLRGNKTAAVIDAKYKRLASSRQRPNGVDQADLYQLAAYASQYEPEQVAALVYPHDRDTEPARAETQGPWHGVGATFVFRRLATEAAACRDELASLLSPNPPREFGTQPAKLVQLEVPHQ